jgi:hypothetical protein
VRDFLIGDFQTNKKADLRRLFYQAGSASYFAAGAAAAGSEAAGAATAEAASGAEAAGAGAATGAGAGAGASACLPQAAKDRAKTAAIREVNFISFPSVDLKITGVLNLFGTHSPKSPSLRKARYSTTIPAKYQ